MALRWTRDGIYAYRPGMPGHLDILDAATGAHRVWKEVVPPDPAGVMQVEPFVVSEEVRSTSTPTAACSTSWS